LAREEEYRRQVELLVMIRGAGVLRAMEILAELRNIAPELHTQVNII
jgi:hypothetical protein